MPSEERARRVANRILEEIADLLIRQISDPRLRLVTITDVKVDRELAYATIYFAILDDQDRIEEVKVALERARGFLRSQLASRIRLRSFPQLRFRYDQTHVQVARIEELLAQIKKEQESTEEDNL
jgi:ribosome-binding factor A